MSEDEEAVDGLTAKLEGDFQKLGLTLYDTNGNLKDTYDILKELSVEYQNMSTAQKAYYTELIAGKTRATEAAAILSNFDRIMQATETAYNSTGSAARENQKVLESLNGSIQKLKSEWESLVNSKSTQDTLKFLVDLTTNIVKIVKALGGLKTILILLVARFVATKVAALGLAFATEVCGAEFAAGLTKAELFALGLKRVQFAATSAGVSIGALTAAIAVSAIAIAGLVALVKYLSEEWERNTEAFDEASDAYNNTKKEVEDLESQLESINQKIEEINSHPIDITSEKTLKDLNSQKALLESELRLKENLLKVERETQQLKGKQELWGSGQLSQRELEARGIETNSFWGKDSLGWSVAAGLIPGLQFVPLIGVGMEIGAQTQGFGSELTQSQQQIERYKEVNEQIKEQTVYLNDLTSAYYEGRLSQDAYNKESKKVSDEITKLKEQYQLLGDDLTNTVIPRLQKLQLAFDEGSYEYQVITGLLDLFNDAVEESTEKVDELTSAQNKLKDSLSSMYTGLKGLKDKYSDLSSAVEEYQANGSLSLDTMLKLQQNYPQYLDYLQNHGFSLENVNSLLIDEANAYIAVAKESAEAEAKAKGLTEANIALAKAALNDAKAQLMLSQSFFSLPEGVQGPLAPNPGFNQDLLDYYNTLKSIDDLEKSLANGFGGYSAKKSSGSSSSKKETDTWKQAFTDAYNELKHRRSLDLIDTKQYIEELTALNDKYFKDRVEYEDEYNKYVEELYKERQNLFKEQLSDLKFAFEMLENQGANKQTLILKYKEIQDALHQQAEYYRSLNLAENNDLIQDLQSQWWDYQKKIKELEQGIADEIEKQNKEIKEQMEKELDLLDERFEALRDYAVDMIDKEIELKEQALQKQNDLLDEQIEKYKEEEDNLENQKDIEDKLLKIEEARKKLAEAKNQKVRVYRAGKGFVYESDFNAVSQAQKQLDELLKEWNLFQEKAKIANIIAELEAEKEANEKRVNAEIADLNTLKDAWDKSLDISKDVENYKGWLTKIESSEKLSFNQRLAQVKTFVTAYNNEMALIKSNYPTTDEVSAVVSKDSNKNAITTGKSYGGVTYFPDVDYQALINNTLANAPESEKASLLKNYETKRNAKIAGEGSSQAQTSLYGGTTFSTTSSGSSKSSSSSSSSRSSSSSSSSKSSSSSSSSGSTTMSKNDQTKIAIAKEAYSIAKSKGDTAGMAAAHAVAESVRANYGYSGGGDGSQHIGLASGTNNADGNIHLVGEEGPELFIPPSGSGIIPNPKTNNLMQWGTINPASLLAAISQGQGTVIEVDNITLPNVRDAESFVEELKNFKNYAIQKQSIRK